MESADFGCVSPDKYREERETIELDHNGEEDFKNQWGLTAIRADRAYAQLELEHGVVTEPGAGQTVGVIDTGIDTEHPMFAGKTVTEHFFSGATDETGDGVSHGTSVASVIVGRPSAAFTASVTAPRGVARGADVAMFALRAGSGGGDYIPVSLASLNAVDDQWASRINHVTAWSSGDRTLDFVNVSVGFKGIIEQYSAQNLRNNLGGAIAALAQAGAGDKTVFVWAAGNAHGDPCYAEDFTGNADLCVDVNGNRQVDAKSPEILAGLPARISRLRGHVIAVVAVAPDSAGDYEIAAFSNRCGIAAQWCIAAPGMRVRLAYFGPDPEDDSPGVRGAYTASGTSFAAPMVTGGLVVMKHYFRSQLSNTALVARLLETANKQGIYSNSSIYGHGLMDLAAATAPVGVTSVAFGTRVGGPGSTLAETRFEPGGALGNGLALAFGGREIAAFDALGAPFWFRLDDLAGDSPGPSMTARLRNFMAPRRAGEESGVLQPGIAALSGRDGGAGAGGLRLGVLQTPPPGSDGGHLSLAGRALTLGAAGQGALSVAAFSTEGMDRQAPASGVILSWRPSDSPLGLRSGLVAERETLLGSSSAGAFGRVSGSSVFAGVEGQARIGGWHLHAGAEIGTVNVAARGGMLATSAFALRAERPMAQGNTLSFSLAQPLRVEAGRARLTVPVGRTKDGQVLRRSFTADLEPSGRQIDATAQWRHSLGNGSELRLGGAGHGSRATTPRPPRNSACLPVGTTDSELRRQSAFGVVRQNWIDAQMGHPWFFQMHNPFRYFNSSPELIRSAVMLYVCYPLSPRQVEDLLSERGIDICHETVRYW